MFIERVVHTIVPVNSSKNLALQSKMLYCDNAEILHIVCMCLSHVCFHV